MTASLMVVPERRQGRALGTPTERQAWMGQGGPWGGYGGSGYNKPSGESSTQVEDLPRVISVDEIVNAGINKDQAKDLYLFVRLVLSIQKKLSFAVSFWTVNLKNSITLGVIRSTPNGQELPGVILDLQKFLGPLSAPNFLQTIVNMEQGLEIVLRRQNVGIRGRIPQMNVALGTYSSSIDTSQAKGTLEVVDFGDLSKTSVVSDIETFQVTGISLNFPVRPEDILKMRASKLAPMVAATVAARATMVAAGTASTTAIVLSGPVGFSILAVTIGLVIAGNYLLLKPTSQNAGDKLRSMAEALKDPKVAQMLKDHPEIFSMLSEGAEKSSSWLSDAGDLLTKVFIGIAVLITGGIVWKVVD